MDKTDQEHLFLENLDFWTTFLDRGHTTCGETGFASHDRSDCHAWSAHPSYYLLSLVAGIQSADIGFNKVRIEPHLGNLTNLKVDMPHLKGRIKAKYVLVEDQLKVEIELPEDVEGVWSYGDRERKLKSGRQVFVVMK